MNKKERLSLIRELVNHQQIETQEELVEHLKEAGVFATQATISRDIKELGIVKIPVGKSYIYGLPKSKSAQLVSKTVLSVRSMGQMIYVSVVPGSTTVLKRQLVERFKEHVFSIIVDDDSLLIIVKEGVDVPTLEQLIKVW